MRRSLGIAAAVALALGLVSIQGAAQGVEQAAPKVKSEAKVKGPAKVKEQAKEQAKEQVKGKADAKVAKDADEARVVVKGVFRSGDREAFERYFASHNMRAKPLPPGMAKRLAKGKPLPPGIAKQVMPADLLKIAPPLPKDAEYGIVGDAVVVSKAGVVLDILAGVLK